MGALNERLMDDTIRHAVYLERLSTGVVRDMLRLIDDVQADINRQIINSPPLSTALRLRRLQKSVHKLHRQLTHRVNQEITPKLNELAVYETAFAHRMFNAAVKAAEVAVEFNVVTAADVRSAVTTKPFQGPHLRWATKTQHVQEWGTRRSKQMQSEIAMGFVEGQSIPNIARRIRETAHVNKRTATALARTAVNHYATAARETYYEENSHVIARQRWLAILDSRTCVVCAALDGSFTKPGKRDGPRPPAHANCRCTLSPVVDKKLDPTFPKAPEWNDWLRRQPQPFVREVLGNTRAKLYLRGELPLDRFIDHRGKLYSLDQLRRIEEEAFAAVGL